MTEENQKPETPTLHSLKLDALDELQNFDFSFLRQSLQTLMHCAMSHEYLDHAETRVKVFTDFKAIYNFLSKLEMFEDPEIEYVNLLTE